VGLGNKVKRYFLNRFSIKLPTKPFFIGFFILNRSDWGFTTTSGQNRSVTGGSKDVTTHISVAKLVPIP
jgi:hypothetical protein